jgi:hypothetical protein
MGAVQRLPRAFSTESASNTSGTAHAATIACSFGARTSSERRGTCRKVFRGCRTEGSGESGCAIAASTVAAGAGQRGGTCNLGLCGACGFGDCVTEGATSLACERLVLCKASAACLGLLGDWSS